MLRTITTVGAAICAIGLIGAPAASAAPKFCENHGAGTGKTYIHACAKGAGGAGPFEPVTDPDTGKVRWVHKSQKPHREPSSTPVSSTE
jgi:hypothetical protein